MSSARATRETNSQAHSILSTLQQINTAWCQGRTRELEKYFHRNMVISMPNLGQRLQGAAACVKSYEAFCAQATVESFREADHQVDIFADTAVLTYRFEIAYLMKRRRIQESGREILFFKQEAGRWLVVWRTLISEAEEQ